MDGNCVVLECGRSWQHELHDIERACKTLEANHGIGHGAVDPPWVGWQNTGRTIAEFVEMMS